MTDYGHDLRFGSFITPDARQPDRVVALAQLAEDSELDLVTFQDHPYQPSFLETWTLISYVAAQTSRVSLSGNVLNLPLRDPAMLAKSAASLDLLSGGRFELGLGAGAFWDAIVALGGRHLSPGESVDALEEAIQIIRAIWDVDDRAPLRIHGEHYQVSGAKRGPAPAHDIGIWLGALKPRMLRLIGRTADGWLPSLSRLEEGALDAGNEVIDEAAVLAGRDPRAIRRLLNVGTVTDVNQLAEFALESGVSTFILASDDPEMIQRYGLEIAPAVREIVEEARTLAPYTGSDTGHVDAQTGHLNAETGHVGGQDEDERLGVRPTPDDGIRLSTTSLWDEATRPSRPAADPEAVYSDTGREMAQHFVDVHDMLRGEFARLQDLVEQVRAGTQDVGHARSAINQMTIRQNDWTLGAYCSRYCTTVTSHHTREDVAIFPHLRRADPSLEPVLDRLDAEHLVIHDVLEELDRALIGLVQDPTAFGPLDESIALLSDTLMSHLAYEERELIEPLVRLGLYDDQF